jgi:hypothetical protein
VSKSGGDSFLPVREILIGKNNCPAFSPNFSASFLNSSSNAIGKENSIKRLYSAISIIKS